MISLERSGRRPYHGVAPGYSRELKCCGQVRIGSLGTLVTLGWSYGSARLPGKQDMGFRTLDWAEVNLR